MVFNVKRGNEPLVITLDTFFNAVTECAKGLKRFFAFLLKESFASFGKSYPPSRAEKSSPTKAIQRKYRIA